MKRLPLILLLGCALCAHSPAERVPQRALRPYGVLLGLMDPYPGLLGLTAAVNLRSYLRLHVGYGLATGNGSRLGNVALGARLFVPDWDLSPWAGLGASVIGFSGTAALQGFTGSGNHFYGGLGVEWQTRSGFTASVGYHVSTRGQVPSRPSLQVGWFFNFDDF